MEPVVTGAIIGAGGGALGMLGQRSREKRAWNRNKEAMGIQYGHQRKLNEQGHDLSYSMWQKTNYPAQMQMMKEAGINPALMYGSAGSGGTTAGQGGGSASAVAGPSPMPMELGSAISSALTASQIKLNEAQANKLNTDATYRGGAETTESGQRVTESGQRVKESAQRIKNLLSGIENDEVKRMLNMAQKYVADGQYNKVWEEVKKLYYSNRVDERTVDDKIEILTNEAIASKLDESLKESNIELNQERKREIYHSIIQKYILAGMKGLDVIVKGSIARNIGKGVKQKSKYKVDKDYEWGKGFKEGIDHNKM